MNPSENYLIIIFSDLDIIRGRTKGCIQKFFEGGVLKFFCMDGKTPRSFDIVFLKSPSKLKKFSQKGEGDLTLPEYASGSTQGGVFQP